MRKQLTLYLPEELHNRFSREAVKQGLSLSAYLTRHLSTMPSQIDELQQWLSARLDRLDAACGAVMDKALQVLSTRAGDGLLARAGMEHMPPELVLGALIDVSRELREIPAQHRQRLTENGRALLARTNGASK
jgi:hypothetical protein